MSDLIKTVILNEKTEGFSVNGNKVFALLKIESENGSAVLSLTTINLAEKTDGDYFFAGVYLNKIFAAKIEKGKVNTSISLPYTVNSEIKVFLLYKRGDILTSVCENKESEKEDLEKIKGFLENFYEKKDATQKETEKEFVFNPQANKFYDDEKIADENYYLNKSEVIKDEKLLLRPSAFSSDGESDKKKEDEKKEDKTFGDEKDNIIFDEKRPFYLTVKEELDKLFSSYQREDSLKVSIPSGDFIKVTYGENEYYVVGIIREKNLPKYICYGIPSVYQTTPPEALKGISSFIPVSVFDLKGEGYFMIFQDAITGECKKAAN